MPEKSATPQHRWVAPYNMLVAETLQQLQKPKFRFFRPVASLVGLGGLHTTENQREAL